MSRKKFAKYMIEERIEQLIPPYKIENWYEPVICANCYREDIMINFAEVQSNIQDTAVIAFSENITLDLEETKILILKGVKCPKCRSGLAYRFKFTIVIDEPKKKKKGSKKAVQSAGSKRRS